MELWGNEPTLMLKDLNKVWKDWLEVFSGLKGMTFSTNGIDCTDDISKENKDMCVRAAKAIGLDICGIDICTKDIEKK